MSYPGDQVTAPPQQWWQDQSGQQDYAPVRAGFGDGRFEPGRGDDGYAAPARDGQARGAGARYVPAARLENAAPGIAGQLGAADASRPREGRGAAPPARPTRYPPAGPARGGTSPTAYPPRQRDGHGAHRVPEPAAGYPPETAGRGARYGLPASGQYAVPAPRVPHSMPFSAPTWSDARDASEGTGVALAERPDEDLPDLALEDTAVWRADLSAARAPELGEAPHRDTEPAPAGSLPRPDVTAPAGGRSVRAAGRTRAAAAQARKTARRKVQTRRRIVVAGVCLPVLAIGAVLAFHRPGGHAPASVPAAAHVASAGSPASHPSPSLGPWQHIGTRAADPAPLTLAQLFPAQFTAGSGSFTRTTQLAGTRCPSAVFGARLQAAVRKDGCTQVMRASYLDAAQKLMGTIGVLNLATSADAGKAGKVTGASEFIAQLTAASGPTHTLTKGTGLEIAEIKGHYLILTWVEFTNHRAPRTAAQRAQLKAFSADLISRTANISLTSRMVTGVPQLP